MLVYSVNVRGMRFYERMGSPNAGPRITAYETGYSVTNYRMVIDLPATVPEQDATGSDELEASRTHQGSRISFSNSLAAPPSASTLSTTG